MRCRHSRVSIFSSLNWERAGATILLRQQPHGPLFLGSPCLPPPLVSSPASIIVAPKSSLDMGFPHSTVPKTKVLPGRITGPAPNFSHLPSTHSPRAALWCKGGLSREVTEGQKAPYCNIWCALNPDQFNLKLLQCMDPHLLCSWGFGFPNCWLTQALRRNMKLSSAVG